MWRSNATIREGRGVILANGAGQVGKLSAVLYFAATRQVMRMA
jgi:hypothetical protein